MKLRSRRFGPFKQEWYSICSKHMVYDKNCNMCNAGVWCNVWKNNLSKFIFKYFPKFWHWIISIKGKHES